MSPFPTWTSKKIDPIHSQFLKYFEIRNPTTSSALSTLRTRVSSRPPFIPEKGAAHLFVGGANRENSGWTNRQNRAQIPSSRSRRGFPAAHAFGTVQNRASWVRKKWRVEISYHEQNAFALIVVRGFPWQVKIRFCSSMTPSYLRYFPDSFYALIVFKVYSVRPLWGSV